MFSLAIIIVIFLVALLELESFTPTPIQAIYNVATFLYPDSFPNLPLHSRRREREDRIKRGAIFQKDLGTRTTFNGTTLKDIDFIKAPYHINAWTPTQIDCEHLCETDSACYGTSFYLGEQCALYLK